MRNFERERNRCKLITKYSAQNYRSLSMTLELKFVSLEIPNVLYVSQSDVVAAERDATNQVKNQRVYRDRNGLLIYYRYTIAITIPRIIDYLICYLSVLPAI